MRKICLLTVLIILAFSQEIFACECAVNPPFLTVSQGENVKTIALVKIRKYLTYVDYPQSDVYVTSMEVEIIEVYQGKEERKRITIWGTEGANCLEYLIEFEINKTYVVALFERGSEYNLSNCGEYWLSVENEIATGRIAENQESIKLEELKKKITQNKFLSSPQFNFPAILGSFSFSKSNKNNTMRISSRNGF